MLDTIELSLFIAKITGGTCLRLKNKKLTTKKIDIIYSFLIIIGLCFATAFAVFINNSEFQKKNFLRVSRCCLGLISLIADIIITFYQRNLLTSVLDDLSFYDMSVKFQGKKTIFYQVLAVISMTGWILNGCITYYVETTLPALETIIYIHFYTSVSMQMLIFAGIMLQLYRRFNHLIQLILSNGNVIIVEEKKIKFDNF